MAENDLHPADDEQFRAALLAYDDALAAGHPPETARDASTEVAPATPKLQELHEVLDFLEAVWPRNAPRGSTTKSLSDAASASDIVTSLKATTGQIGRFHVLRELGRGGFGVVYLARDPKLKRRVALKLPQPHMLVTHQQRKRFVREARATAALDHSHILPVYEIGEMGSICYMVSPYCRGGTLAQFLANREEPLSARQAARLTQSLAEATHYAHTRGVLHRDLKPGNILIKNLAPSEPDDLGIRPYIADFGLAQFIEPEPESDSDRRDKQIAPPSYATQTAGVFGTPAYMAPEQVEGRPDRIGPATDVYGLGAILYQMLTGQPPFSGPGKLELLRQVLKEDPLPPHRLGRRTPLDLEAICLKCLEKRSDKRYASASDLAEDLGRFLQGRPTVARPLTAWRQSLRWIRRHPAVAASATALLLAVVALVIGLMTHSVRVGAYATALKYALHREEYQTREANRLRRLAEDRERAAREQAYASEIGRGWRMWQSGDGAALCEVLNHHRPAAGQDDVRDFAWRYLWSLGCNQTLLRGPLNFVDRLTFSPQGEYVVAWNSVARATSPADDHAISTVQPWDDTLHVWHVPTRSLRWRFKAGATPYGVGFTADGAQLRVVTGKETIRVWDVRSGKELPSISGPRLYPDAKTPYSIVTMSPTGDQFAYTTVQRSKGGELTNAAHLWNMQTGKSRQLPKLAAPISKSARFSPDGALLAVTSTTLDETRNVVQVFDAANGNLLKTSPLLPVGPLDDVAFSRDNQTLTIGACRGSLVIWNWVTNVFEQHRLGSDHTTIHVDVSSRDVTVGGFDDRSDANISDYLAIWKGDISDGQEKAFIPRANVGRLAFSPDGEILAYCSERNPVRLWRMRQQAEVESLPGHKLEAWCVAFSPNGEWLASGADDHTVKLWNRKTQDEHATLEGHAALVAAAAFSPEGRTLATGSFDHTVKLWDIDTRQIRHTLKGHAGPIRSLTFHDNGKLLASVGDDQTVHVWDASTGQLIKTLQDHQEKIRATIFASQHDLLISADNGGVLNFWDIRRSAPVQSSHEANELHSLAITRDDTRLAAGSYEGVIRLYALPQREVVATLEAGQGGARALAFSGDGRILASGGENGAVTLWHLPTAQQLFNLPGVSAQVNSLAFSADDQVLAAALHDGAVVLWKAPFDAAYDEP
jgi:WD40 repeat protein/tRNA A-37 threonylcarbamoyl transferase component Bud32